MKNNHYLGQMILSRVFMLAIIEERHSEEE